jgi:hypothetical protein
VAGKCKREKKALDRAKVASTRAEGRFNEWDSQAEEKFAEAEELLGSTGECFDSQGRLYSNQCVVNNWILAHRALEAAQRLRTKADLSLLDWGAAEEAEEDRKDKYCDCLNRTRPR